MRTVLLDDDLFFSTRLGDGLTRLGHEVEIVAEETGLRQRLQQDEVDLVIVNLGREAEARIDIVRDLKTAYPSIEVLCYAGHKEVEVWKAAREAGCDLMVSNSSMMNDLAGVMLRLTRGHL